MNDEIRSTDMELYHDWSWTDFDEAKSNFTIFRQADVKESTIPMNFIHNETVSNFREYERRLRM